MIEIKDVKEFQEKEDMINYCHSKLLQAREDCSSSKMFERLNKFEYYLNHYDDTLYYAIKLVNTLNKILTNINIDDEMPF